MENLIKVLDTIKVKYIIHLNGEFFYSPPEFDMSLKRKPNKEILIVVGKVAIALKEFGADFWIFPAKDTPIISGASNPINYIECLLKNIDLAEKEEKLKQERIEKASEEGIKIKLVVDPKIKDQYKQLKKEIAKKFKDLENSNLSFFIVNVDDYPELNLNSIRQLIHYYATDEFGSFSDNFKSESTKDRKHLYVFKLRNW